ncbi:hypothetical protein BDP27DRAFT_1363529 [Rhodocollybia butyracea]|uniref:Uncharacterized protein n=1 Tax=Rhodocollybia butyracea TaxID=206335 RepID=A0A9P5PWD4_9AGAR|nr:hypothetical protein BDP27DRAFT_1363529 [Rhodocollybia butyracea]
MVTDTKSVWAEDPFVATSAEEEEAEEEWRLSIIENLAKIHSPGGMESVSSFEIQQSRYSDFAFGIDCDIFKWTWETCFIGHKNSAEIISKHLVLPLISLNHLSFTVGNSVAEMSDSDLEKAIDKLGRGARRSIDTHIKNAVSKPRVTTSIRRTTAMFNSVPDLPPISSDNVSPQLRISSPPRLKASLAEKPPKIRSLSPSSPGPSTNPSKILVDSATESDEGDLHKKLSLPPPVADLPGKPLTPPLREESPAHVTSFSHLPPKSQSPAPPVQPKSRSTALASESDSSPPRPASKKKKVESSSSEDSEEERRKRVAKLKSGGAGGRGGVRQPRQRGGKRF